MWCREVLKIWNHIEWDVGTSENDIYYYYVLLGKRAEP